MAPLTPKKPIDKLKGDDDTPVKALLPSIRQLPKNDPDRVHFEGCRFGVAKRVCAQCVFARHKKQWMKDHPLDSKDPLRGSWIGRREDPDTGEFSIGCSVCAEAKKGNSFAMFKMVAIPSAFAFRQHESSAQHKAAVAVRDGALCAEELQLQAAPPSREFEKVLRQVWDGGRGEILGVGKRQKVRRMRWCLAEARRHMHRHALRSAVSVAIHQDGRKGVLAVRFTCAGKDLRPHSGLLGVCNLARSYDLSSRGVVSGTLDILEQACTSLAHPPYVRREPRLHQQLLQDLKARIELYDTDAAEDEVMAGKLLQGMPLASMRRAAEGAHERTLHVLPNLKVRNKDKPHGARRLCSRPWKADAFLNGILQTVVDDKDSIMNVIRYSDLFKHRFAKNTRAMEVNPTTAKDVLDVSSAKHRFESLAKPLGRGVIYWPALVQTAQHILDERGLSQVSGRSAANFLLFATEEVMLSMAMMADGADEVLALVRFLENEDFDKSQLAPELDKFLRNITALYCGKVVLSTGYTAHMLQILRRPQTVYLPAGKGQSITKTLGKAQGPSEALVNQCLLRFKNWVTLAHGVMQAEFPNFEILQCFHLFHLAKPKRDDHDAALAHADQRGKHIKGLCSCLDLNAPAFEQQLNGHRNLAEHYFCSKNVSSLDAWREALEVTARKDKGASRHEATELRAALVRFAAWGGSTGGVERLFSEGNTIGTFGRELKWQSWSDDMMLLSDRDERKVEELCERARRTWVNVYGRMRTSKREVRVDIGKKKKPLPCKKPSLTEWIRRRRVAVQKAAAQRPASGVASSRPRDPVVGKRGWTRSHEAEMDFQRQKRQRRFIEAVAEGTIPESELSDELKAAVAEFQALEAKATRATIVRREAADRKLANPVKVSLTGKRVFVDKDVDIGQRGSWLATLRGRGAKEAVDRLTADVYVVEDVGDPGKRNLWCAMLAGKTVCNTSYVKSNGDYGAAVTFQAATRTKKRVWCSPAFCEHHPEFFTIIVKNAGQWTITQDRDRFLEFNRKRSRNGHDYESVAFLTNAEMDSQDYARIKNKFTRSTAERELAKIARGKSCSGACLM